MWRSGKEREERAATEKQKAFKNINNLVRRRTTASIFKQ
jgi:hypothetical protein